MQNAKKIASCLLALALTIGTLSPSALAASTTPHRFSYSGTLADSQGKPLTSAHSFRFSLWRDSDFDTGDVTELGEINAKSASFAGYIETQEVVPNAAGRFFTQVGASNPLPNLKSDQHVYLQIEVKAAGTADTEYTLLDPDFDLSSKLDRKPLDSAPYALNADTIDNAEIGTEPGNLAVLNANGTWETKQIPGGTNATEFRLDAGDSGAETAIVFNKLLNKVFKYDPVEGKFALNDGLWIDDNLAIGGSAYLEGKLNGRDITADGDKLDSLALGTQEFVEQQLSINAETFVSLIELSEKAEELAAALQAEQEKTAADKLELDSKLGELDVNQKAGTASLEDFRTQQTGVNNATTDQINQLKTKQTEQDKTQASTKEELGKLGTRVDGVEASVKTLVEQQSAKSTEQVGSLEKKQASTEAALKELADKQTANSAKLDAAASKAHAAGAETGTSSRTFTLNNGKTNLDTSLYFGETTRELRYDAGGGRFVLTDGLFINDHLAISGNLYVNGLVDGRDVSTDGATLDSLIGVISQLKAAQSAIGSQTAILSWTEILAARSKSNNQNKINHGQIMTRAGRVTALGVSTNPSDDKAAGTFFVTKNDGGAYDPVKVMTSLVLNQVGTGDAANSSYTRNPVAGTAGLTFAAGDVLRVYNSEGELEDGKVVLEVLYQ